MFTFDGIQSRFTFRYTFSCQVQQRSAQIGLQLTINKAANLFLFMSVNNHRAAHERESSCRNDVKRSSRRASLVGAHSSRRFQFPICTFAIQMALAPTNNSHFKINFSESRLSQSVLQLPEELFDDFLHSKRRLIRELFATLSPKRDTKANLEGFDSNARLIGTSSVASFSDFLLASLVSSLSTESTSRIFVFARRCECKQEHLFVCETQSHEVIARESTSVKVLPLAGLSSRSERIVSLTSPEQFKLHKDVTDNDFIFLHSRREPTQSSQSSTLVDLGRHSRIIIHSCAFTQS